VPVNGATHASPLQAIFVHRRRAPDHGFCLENKAVDVGRVSNPPTVVDQSTVVFIISFPDYNDFESVGNFTPLWYHIRNPQLEA
ncbi:MAG: hypothetical protein JXD18_11400, partial [Anaerolineae bacterium]|nr:hypothetical protein [Anaerolineae bacterium]